MTPQEEIDLWRDRRGIMRELVAHRRRLKVTQKQMAVALRTTQSGISALESSTDWKTSTLTRYARALGLRLRLRVDPDDDPDADEAWDDDQDASNEPVG